MASVPASPFQGPINSTPQLYVGSTGCLRSSGSLHLWVALGCMAMPIPGKQKLLLARVVFLSWDYTRFKQQNGLLNGADSLIWGWFLLTLDTGRVQGFGYPVSSLGWSHLCVLVCGLTPVCAQTQGQPGRQQWCKAQVAAGSLDPEAPCPTLLLTVRAVTAPL